jgi:hypothetical protein
MGDASPWHQTRLGTIKNDHHSSWDGTARARELIAERNVEDLSAVTVRRILTAHHLNPWRHHACLHPKQPREATFSAVLAELIDLYMRRLGADELVLSVDEKTSLHPRPRSSPTLPAQPPHLPNRYEHEYTRAGGLNLLAASDTRAGQVYGPWYTCKRPREFITFLEHLDREIAEPIQTIHLVCDHVSTPQGKDVTRWFANQPRCVVHFTPVPCAWMNQVERWFSIFRQHMAFSAVSFVHGSRVRQTLGATIGEFGMWQWLVERGLQDSTEERLRPERFRSAPLTKIMTQDAAMPEPTYSR